MTIKECVKKYTVYLKNITHIPAKEVEILIMHLLEKKECMKNTDTHIHFMLKVLEIKYKKR